MKPACRALAACVRLMLLAVALLLGGCDHGPPAPPEVLAQINAYIANGDQMPVATAPTAPVDIFSMPGGVIPRRETPASTASVSKTVITRTEQSASSMNIPGTKPGMTARFCEVWANRTGADGIERSIYRTFYAWQDAAGAWHWTRNPRPSSLEDDR